MSTVVYFAGSLRATLEEGDLLSGSFWLLLKAVATCSSLSQWAWALPHRHDCAQCSPGDSGVDRWGDVAGLSHDFVDGAGPSCGRGLVAMLRFAL